MFWLNMESNLQSLVLRAVIIGVFISFILGSPVPETKDGSRVSGKTFKRSLATGTLFMTVAAQEESANNDYRNNKIDGTGEAQEKVNRVDRSASKPPPPDDEDDEEDNENKKSEEKTEPDEEEASPEQHQNQEQIKPGRAAELLEEFGTDTVEDLEELELFYKSTKENIMRSHNARLRILENPSNTIRRKQIDYED